MAPIGSISCAGLFTSGSGRHFYVGDPTVAFFSCHRWAIRSWSVRIPPRLLKWIRFTLSITSASCSRNLPIHWPSSDCSWSASALFQLPLKLGAEPAGHRVVDQERLAVEAFHPLVVGVDLLLDLFE